MSKFQSKPEVIPQKQFKTFTLEEEDSFLSVDEVKSVIKQEVSRRINSEDLKIPMLPHIAVQVMQLVNDPMVNSEQIANLIKQEQQLAGKLIRIANSPVYAGMMKITSIQRAILQVGLVTLRDLILSVSLESTIFKNNQYKDLMKQIWKHSLAVAFISQELAKAVKIDNEYAFLCGLMHDVGKPILIDIITEVKRNSKEEVYLTEDVFDDMLLEFHQAVGGLIARKWDFPSLLHDAIFFHHRYLQAANSIQMANLIHVADMIHHGLGIEIEQKEINLKEEKAAYDLGLSTEQIDPMMEKFLVDVPVFLAGFSD